MLEATAELFVSAMRIAVPAGSGLSPLTVRAKLRASQKTAWKHNMSTTATQSKPQANAASPKGMLIGGKWLDAKSGARIAIENPAKKVTIAEVPPAAAAHVAPPVQPAAPALP